VRWPPEIPEATAPFLREAPKQDSDREHEPGVASGPASSSPAGQSEDQAARGNKVFVEDDDGTGADSQGLSLLQIAGGPAFRPIAIGNSRYLSRGASVTAVGSAGLTRTFTLDIGNFTSGTGALAAGAQRLTGLLVSTARVEAGEETGGPLVNLSGQAIGISVAGTGSGLHHTGFAVPIDTALAVARRIQAAHSR
jgi:S1-C subfamily serine protease